MPDDLPPLNALRAFEAAGRHLSITRAAKELHVTPAAVSHQVRALEEWLEVKLFRRDGNTLLLTDAGQTLLPKLRAGFSEFNGAIAELRDHDVRGALVLSVAPVFAAKWLIPRLAKFHAANPEIDVRVSATLALADFESDGIDAAIRVGRGRYPGLRADRLFGEELVPMCSPTLLAGAHSLEVPQDLAHHALLHFDWPDAESIIPGWSTWLDAFDIQGVDPRPGPRFTQPDYAMQAAIDGAGVVLGWRSLARADLESNRLVIPFDLPIPTDVAFHLVYPEVSKNRRKLCTFREWLLAEVRTGSNRTR